MRRSRHQSGKRDARIDPIPVDPNIGLQPVDPVERQPLDGLGPGWLGEFAQELAPGSELLIAAPVEAADCRIKALPQAGFGRVVGILEPGSQGYAEPL